MGDGRYGAGELLAIRRYRDGVSLVQMVAADRCWDLGDFAEIESRDILTPGEVRRYIDALEKAGRR